MNSLRKLWLAREYVPNISVLVGQMQGIGIPCHVGVAGDSYPLHPRATLSPSFFLRTFT